jgi:large subunit ribosomal protein L30
MTKRLRITQYRSAIRRQRNQKETIRSLGIRRLHHTVEHDDTPAIRGMIRTVGHLVRVEEVEAEKRAKPRAAKKPAVETVEPPAAGETDAGAE